MKGWTGTLMWYHCTNKNCCNRAECMHMIPISDWSELETFGIKRKKSLDLTKRLSHSFDPRTCGEC